jgi:putative redox protein
MTVTVTSIAGQPYRQAITVRNHVIYSDAGKSNGGQDTAPNPHELLLGALGACTNMTLQMYAKRKGWDLKDVSVELQEKKVLVPGQSKLVPEISKDIKVRGNLSPTQVQSLETIAEKCPVNLLIKDDKQMVSKFNHVV